MKAIIYTNESNGIQYIRFVCPCPECGPKDLPISGTGTTHPVWQLTGTTDNPTLTPSIRTKIGMGYVCHSYLTHGRVRFDTDCTHSLAGKTIELPEIPEKWQKT